MIRRIQMVGRLQTFMHNHYGLTISKPLAASPCQAVLASATWSRRAVSDPHTRMGSGRISRNLPVPLQ